MSQKVMQLVDVSSGRMQCERLRSRALREHPTEQRRQVLPPRVAMRAWLSIAAQLNASKPAAVRAFSRRHSRVKVESAGHGENRRTASGNDGGKANRAPEAATVAPMTVEAVRFRPRLHESTRELGWSTR